MEEDRGKIRKERRLKRRGRLSLFNGDNIKRNEIGEYLRIQKQKISDRLNIRRAERER